MVWLSDSYAQWMQTICLWTQKYSLETAAQGAAGREECISRTEEFFFYYGCWLLSRRAWKCRATQKGFSCVEQESKLDQQRWKSAVCLGSEP
ncbi:Hypothetical predicted protein [Podarcis lilfordi]|uniref:Uncharacterized protein n=1 Tax=Podarcis lilfordi TaxID=74358 RepID=A0AA35JVV6_9SAUR|nr:Hypothetical predicted protein [Podarcis lilfordi]